MDEATFLAHQALMRVAVGNGAMRRAAELFGHKDG